MNVSNKIRTLLKRALNQVINNWFSIFKWEKREANNYYNKTKNYPLRVIEQTTDWPGKEQV